MAHERCRWDDDTAAWYVENYGDHPTNRMTVEAAELRPDDVVVDVGCGGGEAIRVAATTVVRGSLVGVDPTPAMIRIAAEQTRDHPAADRIRFLEGAAEKLPVESASATVVLAINSAHHWASPDQGLGEVLRVLVPGGRFFIGEEETSPGRWGHGEGELSDPDELRSFLERVGFESVRTSRHIEAAAVLLLMTALKPA